MSYGFRDASGYKAVIRGADTTWSEKLSAVKQYLDHYKDPYDQELMNDAVEKVAAFDALEPGKTKKEFDVVYLPARDALNALQKNLEGHYQGQRAVRALIKDIIGSWYRYKEQGVGKQGAINPSLLDGVELNVAGLKPEDVDAPEPAGGTPKASADLAKLFKA